MTFRQPDPAAVHALFAADREFQSRIAQLWNEACAAAPAGVGCGAGCSGCCRWLFDMTLLDGWRLARALSQLPAERQQQLAAQARPQWQALCQALGHDPDDGLFDETCPPDAWPEMALTCALLDDAGLCGLYAARPIVCRRHGLPLLDAAGRLDPAELCEHHRLSVAQAAAVAQRWPLAELYRQEGALERQALRLLLGRELEVVTCLPAVLAGVLSFPEVNG